MTNIRYRPFFILFLLSILAILVMGINGCEPLVKVSCTDSDITAEISEQYVKGTVTISSSQSSDFCLSDTQLLEYSCSVNALSTMVYDCPNGCSDGACVTELKTCAELGGNGCNPIDICDGTYLSAADTDFCCIGTCRPTFEIRAAAYYNLGEFAGLGNDVLKLTVYNPNGFDLDLSESRIAFYGNGDWDMRLYDIAPAFSETVITLKGSATAPLFTDANCDTTISFDIREAATGVTRAGRALMLKCNPEPILACTDSDGGNDYYVKGYVTVNYDLDSGTEGMQNIAGTDICVGNTLKEFYCDSNDAPKINSYDCPNGCVDGACLACTDSDGGIDYYTVGRLDVFDSNDYCSLDNVLVEKFCRSDIMTLPSGAWCTPEESCYVEYTCPYGCQDGACAPRCDADHYYLKWTSEGYWACECCI